MCIITQGFALRLILNLEKKNVVLTIKTVSP